MTNKKQEKTIQNFTFRGIITGTSNKQNAEFANENPRKTAYIKVDKANEDILIQNGLTKYTSEEKEDFFIIKLSENVTSWVGKEKYDLDTSVTSDNFKTEYEIAIACIKGKNKGNNYVRIYALGLRDITDIFMVQQENPFADIEGFIPTDEDIPF